MKTYDIIVIGGGHAGIEAAQITAKMGCKTLLLTMDADCIGKLSCNPAVGGIGKSTLVKETDVLGGLIGRITDLALVSTRILNRGKGEAVWATRAQVDIQRYPEETQRLLYQNGVEILQGEVFSLLVKDKTAVGVETDFGERIGAKKVILCAGTFLKGTIHIGLTNYSGGRLSEKASDRLHDSLKKQGIALKYFKTGTCARLDKNTLDYSKMTEQKPDRDADTFSLFSKPFDPKQRMLSCYITHTTEKTQKIILKNMKYSPLYTGIIKATGVRYCPSIEDKIVKFKDRLQHQIFIEPEGFHSQEIYPNGISTSLPVRVQEEIIHSIPGLEKARIIRPGYGIEHAVIDSTQLQHTLEAKKLKNFYVAGQLNGTTGYEEAAAQGIIAGINAALALKSKRQLILGREESLIGVLIDDLVTKGTNEPYRMFTARSEYRLTLRESNAFIRLANRARDCGTLTGNEYGLLQDKQDSLQKLIKKYRTTKVTVLGPAKKIPAGLSIYEALKRPDVGDTLLRKKDTTFAKLSETLRREVIIAPKYEGFINREKKNIQELGKIENVKLPKNLDLAAIGGLSREVVEKLRRHSPATLKEAFAISGITPASIMILYAYLNRRDHAAR